MKTFLMKVCCLLLLLVGALLLASQFGLDFAEARDALVARLEAQNPEHPVARLLDAENITPGFPLYTVLAGVLFVVAGGLGLLPAFSSRKDKRSVEFETEHGKVSIRLDAVQKSMSQIVGRMPQVKKVKISVKPSRDRKKALVHADVVLINEPHVHARQTAGEVTAFIVDTAVRILGLEDIAKVDLAVDGYSVDTKAAATAIADKTPQLEHQVDMSEVLAPVAVGAYAAEEIEEQAALEVEEVVAELGDDAAEETLALPEEETDYEAPVLSSENEDAEALTDTVSIEDHESTGDPLPPLVASEADDLPEEETSGDDDPLDSAQVGFSAAFDDDDESDVVLPPLGDEDAESLTPDVLSEGDAGLETPSDAVSFSSAPESDPGDAAPEALALDGAADHGAEGGASDVPTWDLGDSAGDNAPEPEPEAKDEKKPWGFL